MQAVTQHVLQWQNMRTSGTTSVTVPLVKVTYKVLGVARVM